MAHLEGTHLDHLWDFDDAAVSEQRLRHAADQAEGIIAAELRTQIARALGLQRKYTEAWTLLDGISTGDALVQQRIALERGRILNASDRVAEAISHFQEAHRLAADAFLTLDAIHMLALTDLARAEHWYHQGLQLCDRAHDARVKRWEGSLRNNYAWQLADQGNLQAALSAFREAEFWFSNHGSPRQLHIARWSVAHILRQLGHREEARQILLELKTQGEPDTYVDDELALLGE